MSLSLKNRFNQAVAGFIAGQAQRRHEAENAAMMEAIRHGDNRGLEKAIARGADVNICYGGKQPDNAVTLLTPISITKDNLNQAERLNEVK